MRKGGGERKKYQNAHTVSREDTIIAAITMRPLGCEAIAQAVGASPEQVRQAMNLLHDEGRVAYDRRTREWSVADGRGV